MSKLPLHYVVFSDFQICLINDKIHSKRHPIGFIKSTWLRNSGGKGMIDYYENAVFDVDHKKVDDYTFRFGDISFKIEESDQWRTIKGSHNGKTLILTIIDKFGKSIEKQFEIPESPLFRFRNISEYLKKLNKFGTHAGVEKSLIKENTTKK